MFTVVMSHCMLQKCATHGDRDGDSCLTGQRRVASVSCNDKEGVGVSGFSVQGVTNDKLSREGASWAHSEEATCTRINSEVHLTTNTNVGISHLNRKWLAVSQSIHAEVVKQLQWHSHY